jgi:RHS repeat-associated protein
LAEGAHKVYLFGMAMVGRDDQGDYRFGFNGKEKNTKLSNGSYDFGARMYDARLGRWLSIDPFVIAFPNTSPYSYAENKPIKYVDKDGNYVVDAATAEKYPNVKPALKKIYKEFKKMDGDNPKLVQMMVLGACLTFNTNQH